MYICKPERNVMQTRILIFTCAIVTLTFFCASTAITQFSGFIRFCGFVSLMISILLTVRYPLTEFEYSVGNGSFSVTKIVGNKRTIICSVALETAIELITKREYKALPKSEKAILKYSLNQNIKAESYVFLCVFNEKRTMIEFEPNERFAAIVKEEIRLAKNDNE